MVKGKRTKEYGLDDDSSTESEEDLAFVQKQLEHGNLGEMEKKLLLGIIQAPPEDKKRYDKETPAQARARRRAKRLEQGLSVSDEYDSEEANSDEYDTIKHQSLS